MTCIVETSSEERRFGNAKGFWHKLSFVFLPRRKKRLPLLEPQALSDHLKRDLDFLDGRG